MHAEHQSLCITCLRIISLLRLYFADLTMMRCVTILKNAMHAQARESSRGQRPKVNVVPHSQNGHMQYTVEHRGHLNTGHVLELKLSQGLE